MAYSIKADFQKVYSDERLKILTRGSDATPINETNLNDAIEKADSLIDSYLQTRVNVLPLANPPSFIKDYSIDIAVKNLYRALHNNDIPETARKNFEDAIKHLTQISKGEVNLITEAEVERNEKVSFDESATEKFTSGSY